MKISRTFLIALSAAGALGGAAILAHAGPGGGMEMRGGPGFARHGGPAHAGAIFRRMDANGDGVVTRQEVEQARMARFAKIDADNDGKVTAAEIDAAIRKRLEARVIRMRYRMLGRLDANGDGVIGRDEFIARRMKMFARADLDGDGKIDQAEAAKLRKMFKKGVKRRMMRRMKMMRGMDGGAGFCGRMGD